MKIGNNKRGFTLIELLVVISIIALLLSILMPSLQKAKFLAQRVVCFNNVKNQHLPQMMYATDNDDKFAPHNDFTPGYARSAGVNPESQIHEQMRGTYISNSKILLCPLQKKFPWYNSDLEYYDVGYGGWDNEDRSPAGLPALHVATGYNWYANFGSSVAGTIQFDFTSHEGVVVNEPKWPKKGSECTSRGAFISHDVTWSSVYGIWWDHGHGGQPWGVDAAMPMRMALGAKDSPVGYGDGHVETTNISRIKPRAIIPNGNAEIYY